MSKLTANHVSSLLVLDSTARAELVGTPIQTEAKHSQMSQKDISNLIQTLTLPAYYVAKIPSPVEKKDLPISAWELKSIVEDLKADNAQKIFNRLRPVQLKDYEKKTSSWSKLVSHKVKNLTRKLTATTPISPDGYNLVELALQHGSIEVLTKLLAHFPDVQELVHRPYAKNNFRPDIIDTWMNLLVEKNSPHLKDFETTTRFKWSNDFRDILTSKNSYRINRQFEDFEKIKGPLISGFRQCLKERQFSAFETALSVIVRLPQHTESQQTLRNSALSEALLSLAHLPREQPKIFQFHPLKDEGIIYADVCEWASGLVIKILQAAHGGKSLLIDYKLAAPCFAFACLSNMPLTKENALENIIFKDIPYSLFSGQTDNETGLGLPAYAIVKNNTEFAIKALEVGLRTHTLAIDLAQCLTQAVIKEDAHLVLRLLNMGADPELRVARTTVHEYMDIPSQSTFTETAIKAAKNTNNSQIINLLESHMVKELTKSLGSSRHKSHTPKM